jgi:hypothetical protein
MSVIGRLDDQVDEILITPLRRKNEHETTEQKDEQSSLSETTQTQSHASKKGVEKRNELPVWLL